MTAYKFSEDLNIRLVQGIEKGYSDYAEVRREKRNELRVSGAYAWVKGNHIEDRVAGELEEIGIECKLEKAGFTWEYLSFNETKEKHLILIKNAKIIKGRFTAPTLDTANHENYMVTFSKINAKVDFDRIKGVKQGSLQFPDLDRLSTTDDQSLEELKSQYQQFYILTYTIDPASRMLMDIDLWMPEYIEDGKVEMVYIDSLTKYLDHTGTHINQDAIRELVDVPEEEFSGTPHEFDFTSIEDVDVEDSGNSDEHGIQQNSGEDKKRKA